MDYIKGELGLDNVLLATWPPSGEVSCAFLLLDSPFLVLVREGSLWVHPGAYFLVAYALWQATGVVYV
jgi:hypothetical protein